MRQFRVLLNFLCGQKDRPRKSFKDIERWTNRCCDKGLKIDELNKEGENLKRDFERLLRLTTLLRCFCLGQITLSRRPRIFVCLLSYSEDFFQKFVLPLTRETWGLKQLFDCIGSETVIVEVVGSMPAATKSFYSILVAHICYVWLTQLLYELAGRNG